MTLEEMLISGNIDPELIMDKIALNESEDAAD